jgi:hypothetical protein
MRTQKTSFKGSTSNGLNKEGRWLDFAPCCHAVGETMVEADRGSSKCKAVETQDQRGKYDGAGTRFTNG